jgi:tetrapyrrole methylase family protein / MazG family protein
VDGRRPRITVVGLGPAGPALLAEEASRLLRDSSHRRLRTARHPAAARLPGTASFDELYESAATFEDVYAAIVEALVGEARRAAPEPVVYAVPGSPLVAERTVELLRADDRVDVTVVPAVSFLDLVWDRLGIDPVREEVQLVDAISFPGAARRGAGPFLIAQCWTRQLLSDVKLSVPDDVDGTLPRPVVLHHLGLDDELVAEVDWWELDRTIAPDHLTSVYVPAVVDRPAPARGAEVVRLLELMDTLRARCPWDGAQTHATLMPHLVEECYEVLDALSALEAGDGGDGTSEGGSESAYAHLEEELGDLLFQIVFHARLAGEQDAFDMDDVARGIHDKLVHRHPHVFGDVAADTADQVVSNWEAIKKSEKGRNSVTEGVPTGLPALMLAAKLARKGRSVGVDPRGEGDPSPEEMVESLTELASVAVQQPDDPLSSTAAEERRLVGELLLAVTELAQKVGVDAEQALRARALALRDTIVAAEGVPDREIGNR